MGSAVVRTVLLSACLLAFGPAMASGQTMIWRPLAVGGGGFITGGSIDQSGTHHFIRTDVYGGYYWSRRQNRWIQYINSATVDPPGETELPIDAGVQEVAVAPGAPSIVYVAFRGTVWRSSDGGRKFRRTRFAPVEMDANDTHRLRGPRMAIDPKDPDLVLFGTACRGVWGSSDGGDRWSELKGLPLPRECGGVLIWLHPTRPEQIFASPYGQGLWRSADRGKSWKRIDTDANRISHGAFAPDGRLLVAGAEGLYSVDGDSVRRLDRRPMIGNRSWASIASSPDGEAIFAIDEGGRLFKTRDEGTRWHQIPFTTRTGAGDVPWLAWKNNDWLSVASIQFDPAVPNRIWLYEGSGVWFAELNARSESVNWVSHSRGIEELGANDVLSTPDGGVILAGWDFGLRRVDAANPGRFAATHGPARRFNSAWSLSQSISRPGFIVASVGDHRWCCSEDGLTIQSGWSDDAGRTWHRFNAFPVPPGARSGDPWAISFGQVVASSNDPDNLVWLPSLDRSPYWTKDRGKTWHRVVLPGESLPNTGSHRMFYLKRQVMVADQVLPGTFYFVHSGVNNQSDIAGVWMTSDGGSNWKRVSKIPPRPFSEYNARLAAVPTRAGHLYFTTGPLDQHESELMHTSDGGASWRPVPGVKAVSAIGFGLDRSGRQQVYLIGKVAGKYGIWRRDVEAEQSSGWDLIGRFPAGSLNPMVVIDGDRRPTSRVFIGSSGSGWYMGELANCNPERLVPEQTEECFAVAVGAGRPN